MAFIFRVMAVKMDPDVVKIVFSVSSPGAKRRGDLYKNLRFESIDCFVAVAPHNDSSGVPERPMTDFSFPFIVACTTGGNYERINLLFYV